MGERILRTMILTVAGLALFGLFRPDSPDPTEDSGSMKTWFFINKTHQEAGYDLVVVGDSRALRGVSANTMAEDLDGLRAFNFSFHAGGMNPEMYQEAEKLLDENSDRPTIVLAPTALSFLPSKARNAQFHEYRAKPRDQVWIYTRWPALAHWFQPVIPSVIARRFFGEKPIKLFREDFQADGWIGTDRIPPMDLTDLEVHQLPLIGKQSDPEQIRDLMDQTREWTASGVKVFAFFPPAHDPRVAQEDSMLGFDQDSFVQSFKAVGGIWLEPGEYDYQSYDGSHLDKTSALELSRHLGRQLAPHL